MRLFLTLAAVVNLIGGAAGLATGRTTSGALGVFAGVCLLVARLMCRRGGGQGG